MVQKDCLKDFQTEFQESAAPSQLKVIFSKSPISSSVNTKKVLVRFRPTPLGLVGGKEQAVRSQRYTEQLRKPENPVPHWKSLAKQSLTNVANQNTEGHNVLDEEFANELRYSHINVEVFGVVVRTIQLDMERGVCTVRMFSVENVHLHLVVVT